VRSASLWLAVVGSTIALVALASPAQARGIDRFSTATILRQADRYMVETRAIHHVTGRVHRGRFYRVDRLRPEHAYVVWSGRLTRARRVLNSPPHRRAWECIHRYEGSWKDTGAPYYGGLQMDWGFMSTYGGWLLTRRGPANNWSPAQQMWVAERALAHGRGFYPWPNSARMCGLI
jgi:hypothetical protein